MRALAGLALLAMPAAAQDFIPVPSGMTVTWVDTVNDAQGPMGLTARFRFLAPQIGNGAVGFDAASADMQALCDSWALPRISVTGPQPAQIVIVLMDRVVEFGVADESATQFFEAYSMQDGACIWEAF
jgi:Family of unknown function (DUF6497)